VDGHASDKDRALAIAFEDQEAPPEGDAKSWVQLDQR